MSSLNLFRRGGAGARLTIWLALAGGAACSSASSKKGPPADAATDAATGTAGAAGGTLDAAADMADDAPTDATAGAAGAGGADAGAAGTTTVVVGDSVLMHHHNPSHDGVYVQPKLTKAAVATLALDAAFKAVLPDPKDLIYAQPLYVDAGAGGTDLIIVATEANNIYALDATTGAIVWTKNLGTPVPRAMMSCGNLDPYGVTGTPVIDLASRTLYAAAAVLPATGGPTYELFALSLDGGAPRAGWPIDMSTKAVSGTTVFTPKTQGQRGALAFVNGTLYVPFGGLYGACSPFHGWLVAVSAADPTQVKAWATPAAGGGMWSPGGISSDGTSLFVQTGSTLGTATWAGGDAVLRFGTGPAFGEPADSFAPTSWHTLDQTDTGGGAAPVLFTLTGATPSALALSFTKEGHAYLLDQAHLGGISAALGGSVATQYSTAHVASNPIISSPVIYQTAVATYVTFKGNGVLCPGAATGAFTTYKIAAGAPPVLTAAWCGGVGTGSPMVTTSDGKADAIVWIPGAESTNHLQALDGDTGAIIPFPGGATTLVGLARFTPPIAAKGRIFVAGAAAVFAFSTP